MPPFVDGHNETTHCKPDQTPLWKIILETGAVAVGIVVAWIYYGQLQVMQGQLGEIIKQCPELQKSADAMRCANALTESSYINDQRAWIGISLPQKGYQIRSDSQTKKPIDILEIGTSVLIVHARIDYTDIRDRPHWITFCRNISSPGLVDPECMAYNNADKQNIKSPELKACPVTESQSSC